MALLVTVPLNSRGRGASSNPGSKITADAVGATRATTRKKDKPVSARSQGSRPILATAPPDRAAEFMAADQHFPPGPAHAQPADPRPWVIAPVPPERTRALRRRVLGDGRLGRYRDDPGPPGVHLGAFDGEGRLIGSAAVHPEPYPAGGVDTPGALWRLRAMAVEPNWRGRGLGAELLHAAFAHAHSHGAAGLWCHALESARGFYLTLGFLDAGEPFAPPGAALHRTMHRTMHRG